LNFGKPTIFLANSLHVVVRPSVCRLSVMCVRPTQPVEILAMFVRHLVTGYPLTYR